MKKVKRSKNLASENKMDAMVKLDRDQGASLFFFGIGIVISLLSLQYEHGTFSAPGPGFISFWSGIAVSFFSVIGFLVTWVKSGSKKKESVLGPFWFKSFVILLSLAGYAFLLEFFGFLICTFLFMFILLRIIEPLNWKVVFAGSLITAMASYVVFHVWLKTQLPMGILRYLIY
jgi:putative tricarboxylic transport membrane protein